MEGDAGFGAPVIEKKRDEAAERVQKLFQDFLEEFEIEEDGKKLQKYKILAEELAAPEKNTLNVEMTDVHRYVKIITRVIHASKLRQKYITRIGREQP